MLAAGYNTNPEIMSILIDAGADSKLKDNKGLTALHYEKYIRRKHVKPPFGKRDDSQNENWK